MSEQTRSVLITNDLTTYNLMDMSTMDLAIELSNDGASFRIVKNRHGVVSDDCPYPTLPIDLLPKVIANPSGALTYNWTKL